MKTNIARQLVAQGRRYVQQNPEKVRAMTDKAGEFVDQRTGRKYSAHITKARASAGRYLDKRRLDRRR